MVSKLEEFKKSFFDLPSRAFGETFVQRLLYEILGDQKFVGNEEKGIKSNLFDAQRGDLLGEYKAVRVVFENEVGNTMYEQIVNTTPMSKRIGTLQDIEEGNIVSNFQNVKLNDENSFDFDYLVYVLVDNNGFHIYEISGEETNPKEFPNFCANHGSKEAGKNGQFPINKDNLKWHTDNCHIKDVPWKQILSLSKKIKMKKRKYTHNNI